MTPAPVLVTGATGLVGANICRLLVSMDRPVRALVRPTAETEALADLGVQLVPGDITAVDRLQRAAEGCDRVIHCAAVLGGASQDPAEFEAVNVGGTRNVLDLGARRTVVLSTTTFFDLDHGPLTETSPPSTNGTDDPYTLTKRAAFELVMARAEVDQHVCIVVPGGIYGPSPCTDRSLAATSFNRAILSALRGRLTSYVHLPVPWVLAEDVARVALAAADRGRAGQRYLAMGRPEDVITIAAFLSRACELAGVEHSVADIVVPQGGDVPDLEARFGPSLVRLAAREYPVPFFDNAATMAELGGMPTALDEGLATTITWFRDRGLLAI